MSVFAEFELSSDAFALSETLDALPDVVIEVERVVASEELLTPYFWVGNVTAEEFDTATQNDPSIQNIQRLDTFEEAILYRAEWTENIESIVYAYTQVAAVILNATGHDQCWQIQLRFDDHDQLRKFQTYCQENDVSFGIKRLHEVSHPHTGRQFGLTEKQHESLLLAWEAGFFKSPAETSLDEIAAELGISQQALSQRIRKAQHALVAHTLAIEPPSAK